MKYVTNKSFDFFIRDLRLKKTNPFMFCSKEIFRVTVIYSIFAFFITFLSKLIYSFNCFTPNCASSPVDQPFITALTYFMGFYIVKNFFLSFLDKDEINLSNDLATYMQINLVTFFVSLFGIIIGKLKGIPLYTFIMNNIFFGVQNNFTMSFVAGLSSFILHLAFGIIVLSVFYMFNQVFSIYKRAAEQKINYIFITVSAFYYFFIDILFLSNKKVYSIFHTSFKKDFIPVWFRDFLEILDKDFLLQNLEILSVALILVLIILTVIINIIIFKVMKKLLIKKKVNLNEFHDDNVKQAIIKESDVKSFTIKPAIIFAISILNSNISVYFMPIVISFPIIFFILVGNIKTERVINRYKAQFENI